MVGINKNRLISVQYILRPGVPLLWAGVILWLSLTSSPPQISGLLGWDKLMHAGAYGLLTILVAQFFLISSAPLRASFWQAGLVALAYGAVLEVLQLLAHTGRTAEWWDLVADAVGVSLALILLYSRSDYSALRSKSIDKSQK